MCKSRTLFSTRRNMFVLFLVLFAILGVIGLWSKVEIPEQKKSEQSVDNPTSCPEQRLLISVVENDEIERTTLFSSGSPNACGKIFSYNLESIDIQQQGIIKPLEEALRDHSVSFYELIAWAALDAENGFCKEIVETKRGLTMFRYKYREFDLSVFQDVYQTPDGNEHLIRTCTFFPPGGSASIGSTIVTDENGAYLDREDWGIALELIEVSPSNITFKIHQAGGQHIGNLMTDLFLLDCKTSETSIHSMMKEFSIENGGTTTISLNWEDACGKLASGTYLLTFMLTDIFTKEQQHPLMIDYHESQMYQLEFTIP